MDNDYIDSYQRWQDHTQWASVDGNVAWAGLGLASEAGEVVTLLEKHIRKGTHPSKEALTEELGDVLWNVANICNLYDIKISDCFVGNIDKIERRRDGR